MSLSEFERETKLLLFIGNSSTGRTLESLYKLGKERLDFGKSRVDLILAIAEKDEMIIKTVTGKRGRKSATDPSKKVVRYVAAP